VLAAAKTSVFFIDDDQVVRPGETGSSAYIREHTARKNAKLFEYELEGPSSAARGLTASLTG